MQIAHEVFRVLTFRSAAAFLLHLMDERPRREEYHLRNGEVVVLSCLTDYLVFLDIFVKRVYGPVRGDGLVVDVGGHVGLFARYAASARRPVLSFEPEPLNQSRYEVNRQLSPSRSHIKLFRSAVGVKASVLPLYHHIDNTGGHSLMNGRHGVQTNGVIMVPVVRLEAALGRDAKKARILKLDCEGMEFIILKSLSDKFLQQLRLVLLEYDTAQRAYSLDHVQDFLHEKGFNTSLSNGIVRAER